MTSNQQQTIASLGAGLLTGQICVVDCSSILGPSTTLQHFGAQSGGQQPAVEIHKISEYDEDGPFFAWNWLKVGEHAGTHFDAPHTAESGRQHPDGSTETVDPQKLIAPACVIDVSQKCAEQPGCLLDVSDVEAWEASNGPIPSGCWFLMRSGLDARSVASGDDRHPGPTADCIRYLIEKDIVGFGSDCLSTDASDADQMEPPYPAHHLLHAANRFGLASLENLERLPVTGAIFIAAPLKLCNGTGSPIRAMALVPA
ncbi:MAG: cyclase family protein [Rhizobiaceae bacterium]|nr:cyclase family protein [Rhizobiaceae bacterium]